jgi:peptidase C13-like protein
MNDILEPLPNDIPPSPDPPQQSWGRALTRLWCLRPLDVAPRGNPTAANLALSLCLLAAWVLIDHWQRQPDPEFSIDGIPLLGWYVMAVLGLVAILEWRSAPRPPPGAVLLLGLGAVPLPLLLFSVATYLLNAAWFWAVTCVVGAYLVAYLARGLQSLTGRSQRVAASAGFVFIAAFVWVSNQVNAVPDLWNPRDSSVATTDDALVEREAALFEQADRIDTALEAVHRDAGVGSQAFFLGFAGVGDEKVFAQEIGLASRVVGERFHVGDRHLSLVNDERDLQRAPLASVSGLVYALRGLAERMDLDKDVLFLSISSHGSQEPVIAVSNSQFPFRDLTADDLTGALHESGIKWRVIIISACYAGGFIDSLRDAHTIVIAAAAADRTSFGCSNDRDLTYFGEAFYRDALPEAKSLREAFETAKKAIALREHEEKETPSNPQAYFGEAMEAKLGALQTN